MAFILLAQAECDQQGAPNINLHNHVNKWDFNSEF